MKKVQEEIRKAFKTDEDITVKSVNSLSYMLAVLNESMRVFPPTAFGIPRIISTKGGQTVAGNYLPENASTNPFIVPLSADTAQTRVAIFHQAAYRSESNFTRPDEFLPQRWLDDAPSEFKHDRRDVLQPVRAVKYTTANPC